jgi:hypothetical protein
MVGTSFGAFFSAAIPIFTIYRALKQVLPLLGKHGEAFAFLLNPLKAAKQATAGFMFSSSGLLTALSFIPGPIGWIVTGVQALGDSSRVASRMFPVLSRSVMGFTAVWGKLFPVVGLVNSAFQRYGTVISAVTSIVPGPLGFFGQHLTKIAVASRLATAANTMFAGPLGRVVMLFGRFASFIPVIGGGLSLLSGPVGLIVSAIGILTYMFWDELKPAFDWLTGAVSGLFARLAAAFGEIKAVFGNMLGKMVEDLKRIYQGIKDITGLGESSEEKAIREEQEAYEKEEAERVARSNREQAEADKAFQQDGPQAAKAQTFATFSARSAVIAGMGISTNDKQREIANNTAKTVDNLGDIKTIQQGAKDNLDKLNRMFKFG